jgi:hypothetical protein
VYGRAKPITNNQNNPATRRNVEDGGAKCINPHLSGAGQTNPRWLGTNQIAGANGAKFVSKWGILGKIFKKIEIFAKIRLCKGGRFG